MDPSKCPTRSSPRRELQGHRPTHLRVRTDSHKVKKPPLAPMAAPYPRHRPPVIIYTVSPKVIHANPSEFMSLVQRLTGPSSSYDFASSSASESLSPADRYLANTDNTRRTISDNGQHVVDQLGFDHASGTSLNMSVSAPNRILLTASSDFFSPPSMDTSKSISISHRLSPTVDGSRSGFVDNNYLVSPSNMLATPVVPSPGAYWDLFNGEDQDFRG